MVSFSSGRLSGEVLKKRPLENGYVPKYKPRKVSAIRNFPPWCGPNAVPMNLKPEENDGSEAMTVGAIGVKNSEMTDAVVDTGRISEIAVLVEPEAVGNSEMTNKTEADVVKTAEVPELVKLHEIKSSEIQNVVGASSVKSSSTEAEYQENEAVISIVDADITESLNALVGKVVVNADDVENLMMETGPLGIQLPNEVECHRHEAISNAAEVEGARSLDAMVEKVTTTIVDCFLSDVDELVAENEPIGVGKLNEMITDSSNKDTEFGGQLMLKKLNAASPQLNKELLLGSSQALSSSTSSRPKDKYRRRRVSAVRNFPPNCGRDVPLLTEEEEEMVSSGNGLLDRTENVELDPETTMSGNILEGGAIADETSQKECLDGPADIPVKRETTEASNAGQLVEETEVAVEGRFMDSEECNRGQQHSIIEKTEAREAVPCSGTASKAVVDTSIGNTGGTVGKEIVVYSPGTDFSSGKELHREVVHGLMAAPHCPWRKGKVALKNSDGRTIGLEVSQQNLSQLQKSKAVASDSNLRADCSGGKSPETAFPDSYDADGRPGSLAFKDEEDSSGYDECVPQITPISMFRAVDNGDNYFLGSLSKDIVVYSPEENNEMRPSHSAFRSGDEVDREVVHGLMAAPFCPWRKGKTDISNTDGGMSGENKRKKISSWQQKAKAVARKSNPKAKFSRLPSKKHKGIHVSNDADESHGAFMLADNEGHSNSGDFSPYSPATPTQQDCEVSQPLCVPDGSGLGDARSRVRKTLRDFHSNYRRILREEETKTMPEEEGKSKQSGKKLKRIDLEAAKVIKEGGKEVNTGKILGQVPGVEVGDEFQYRAELALVGIHRPYQAGIDWMKLNGVPVATSIIASGAYADDMENADVVIYSGQGGNVIKKGKEPEDQKLERGNLALKNSISAETPVRVVRGWKDTKIVDPLDPKPKTVTTYVYDGLYTVKRYWREKGPRGKQVFKFELRRNPGQPELAWKELKNSSKSKFRAGVCVTDISEGKERLPICAVNTQDDEKPPSFTYTSKMIYPDWYNPVPPAGCDCTGRCTDSRKCRCAVRNGGEIPYNQNGAIVECKPLVYECGPHCRCPPSCYNRVSQRGIRFQLEIFKTESRGWGVRPLTSIPSGSFICEYAGELLEDKEAEKRIGSDEYLFDIGKNYVDSSHTPEDQALSAELMEEGGYTIDVFQWGNIGRFINHSCSPNLYAQNVIYDNNDKRMPHVMFFAAENIPPLQELTYHYNYSVDEIRDSSGNIKVKKCYCGTEVCTGRMY
ncbi:histone H3 (Lys9) methyltransferase SUV39H1/Clr4, required for transcriptional silencing [Handroanthus impetiginosus]|uniref:Histone H3 (Lys9) methyltransferase SUV39H1/Clr4, required for transcriptional silencing n=1 Tax=Handroanthus impetiginosus TaxID=429701 RepID=A0A2G9GWK6_9LAMI|nr:histone H3 (Lys9) methyltransferase SUV39H1/Clr4, required for transcriptional silencing [Handroanthus impetiginosus]